MIYTQRALTLLGFRLPTWASPQVEATVSPLADGWKVQVEVSWRRRLVCRYSGVMRPL